jgi:hypothetical protein
MKMQKKDLGFQAINIRLALCKVCITACFAIALSLFLFACGNGANTETHNDSTTIQADTTTAVDTPAITVDSVNARQDSSIAH